jgi:hypothetical protein
VLYGVCVLFVLFDDDEQVFIQCVMHRHYHMDLTLEL